MSKSRTIGRLALGALLTLTGTGHLTFLRQEYRAQVPEWVPVGEDTAVLASGIFEVAQGAALIALPRHRRIVGAVVAAFFVAIFPGNIAQYREGTDGFGLNSDRARLIRLLFQPLLVVWALWSCEVLAKERDD